MKRIGIMTFQRTTNYGAQYQNYALQEYLKKLKNLDVKVIDYDNMTVNGIEKKLELKDQKNVKDIIKFFKNGSKKKSKWEKFENFRNEKIVMTDYYDRTNITSIVDKIDFYLVGSDQIWNPYITGNDYNYFLEFEKEDYKKYSYAASFGNYDFSEEIKEKIKDKLTKFHKITVREESAVEFLNDLGIKNSKSVIDPTFLLSRQEWEEKLKLSEDGDDYILVYMIDDPQKNMVKIKKIAKQEKLKIIYINNEFFNINGVKNLRDCSPVDFLNYLKKSKYIITGSFHAICMSLIFQKEFFYILNNKLKRNSRIIDLMEELNINGRDITNNTINTNNSLNYDTIKNLLSIKINNSKNILNGYYEEWIKDE